MEEILKSISNKLWQVGDLLSAYDRGFEQDTLWEKTRQLRKEVLDLFDQLPEEIQQQIPRFVLLKEGNTDMIGAWSFGADEIKAILKDADQNENHI